VSNERLLVNAFRFSVSPNTLSAPARVVSRRTNRPSADGWSMFSACVDE
jgi:hypothetical protein